MDNELIAKLSTEVDPKLLSPLVWAYIGDAVFELFIRCRLIPSGKKVEKLHRQTVTYVKAQGQADILAKIAEELTDEEKDIVRRGRNSKSTPPRNADVTVYRYSTGFEALIGYLYLTGQTQRLWQLLSKIDPTQPVG